MANSVIVDIVSGVHDDCLDAIVTAARDRQKAKAKASFYTVKPGATGRLTRCRPKYLNGAPFTVVKKRQTKISVNIDPDWLNNNPQAKGRWSGEVICPPEMLEFD